MSVLSYCDILCHLFDKLNENHTMLHIYATSNKQKNKQTSDTPKTQESAAE